MTALTLRAHEARTLAKTGKLFLVRPEQLNDFGFSVLRHPAVKAWEFRAGRFYPVPHNERVKQQYVSTYPCEGIEPPIRPGEAWGRETWGVGTRPDPQRGWRDGIEYRADEALLFGESDILPLYDMPEDCRVLEYAVGWHSPVTMPRVFSRFPSLTVSDPEPFRVWDVTDEQAFAAGIEEFVNDNRKTCAQGDTSARATFFKMWEQDNPGREPETAWAWGAWVTREDKA